MKKKNTKPKSYPKTPELDRMKAVTTESQQCGQFLEWLLGEKGYSIVTYHKHGPDCAGWDEDRGRYHPSGEDRCGASENELMPVHINIQQLLAEYFGIDLDKVENERRAILERIQAQE
jgi:hypothetical protein